MICFLVNAIKIIFALGFLILIHEGGHFLVARLCKVNVLEFSIGFGPVLLKKKTEKTMYTLRLIPLGGYVNLEGENESVEKEDSFSQATIPRRMSIVVAGGLVNIIFGVVTFFILATFIAHSNNLQNTIGDNLYFALIKTKEFIFQIFESLKMLVTGKVGIDQFMGPVGISQAITQTTQIVDYIYMITLISLSLGVTNLLPIPALDGGKFVLLIIELIRKKKLSEKTETNIQLIGFAILLTLSLYVAYNDILRIL